MTIFLQTIVSGIVAGGVYGLLGVGLSLTYKTTGVVNFAHGNFALLGGYVAFALAQAGVPLAVCALGGIAAGALVSALMERTVLLPLYSRSLLAAMLATFGVATVLEAGTRLVWGSVSLSLAPLASTQAWDIGIAVSPLDLTMLFATLAVGAALALAVERTRTGRAMRGCAQDDEVASLLGVPTRRLYLIAFLVAGATAGLAGVLITPSIGLIPSHGLGLTVVAFAAAILGGLGSVPGALVGGLLIGVLENLAAVYVSGSYANIVGYLVIAAVLLVRVRGLFGDELEVLRRV